MLEVKYWCSASPLLEWMNWPRTETAVYQQVAHSTSSITQNIIWPGSTSTPVSLVPESPGFAELDNFIHSQFYLDEEPSIGQELIGRIIQSIWGHLHSKDAGYWEEAHQEEKEKQEKWFVTEGLSWEMRFTNSSANQMKKVIEHRNKIWAHWSSSNLSLPAQACFLQTAQLVSPTFPKDSVSYIIHIWELSNICLAFLLPLSQGLWPPKNVTNRDGERWVRNQRGLGRMANGGWEMQQTPVSDLVES